MEKTVVQKISDLMDSVIKEHDAELENCRKKVAETKERIAKADEKLQAATSATDFDAYTKAKQEKQKEETALEMYTAKLKQTEAAGYITEDKSDSAIETLFKYEDDIAAAYLQESAKHIAALMDLSKTYADSIERSRDVLGTWVNKVHPYYKGSTVQIGDKRLPANVFRAKPESQAVMQVTNEYKNNAALMLYVRKVQEGGKA